MRRFAAALAAVFCLLAARAQAQTSAVALAAQQIVLYANRGLLVAQGGVDVRMPDLEIVATRAAYDLRANRLTLAGDVTVKRPSGASTGTGYVYDFAHKRGSFVEGASVPQFDTAEALAIGQQVELHPGVSMTFSNAQVRSGTTLVPAASYTYDIPPPNAKNFGYSPVPSAALEWPFVVTSGRDGYTFARLRYDKYNGGPGTGLEEHFASSARGYAAFAQTLDVDGGRFDLAAYQQIDDSLSQSLTGSSLAGAHSLRYAVTATGRRGFAQLSFAQYDAQRSDDLLLAGNQRAIAGFGSARLQIDAGHDVHPGDWHVAQDFRITPALHVDTASVHFGEMQLSGSFDLGESLYDYGRATLASSAGLFSTAALNPHLQLTGSANVWHDAPPAPATLRTYSAGMTWKPSTAFSLISSLTYAHDYGQLHGFGRPQFSAAFDMTVRRKNGTGLEVGTIVPFGGVGDMNRQAVFNVRFLR